MAGRLILAIFLVGAAASAATLETELRGGGCAVVRLESAVDDAHLANPPGYFLPESPAARVVESIVIENSGREPIRDPDVRLNGVPLLPVADPLAVLGVKDATDLLELYSAWRDRKMHASTDLDTNREPLQVLRVFGGTFCGDDARALGAITISHGAEVRFPKLNGHSAAEHRMAGGEWTLLDGDQNAFYLRWDNRHPASAADVISDPLLVLRTKIYGRHARWELAAAWQNLARFEFVTPAASSKTLRLKHPPLARSWEFLPGEKLTIRLGKNPELAFGASEELRKNSTLRAAGCLVEFHIDSAARSARNSAVALPFPVCSAGEGEPIYEARPGDDLVVCHAACTHFPSLRAGDNELAWAGNGALRISFETREISHRAVSPPTIHLEKTSMGMPRFAVEEKSAQRLWWQIATDRGFRVVPPNFDDVREFAALVEVTDPLQETFFSPGREYYFRAKLRCDGVWSDWCEPVAFTVQKPEQPRLEESERLADGRVRLRWKPSAGKMEVFGSDRIDFLPEVFGKIEPTRIENNAIRESRKNQNLLATVSAGTGEAIVPERAAYRLIAEQEGIRSVPSALLRLSDRPARVLQNRHEKPKGSLTGRDLAIEMAVP